MKRMRETMRKGRGEARERGKEEEWRRKRETLRNGEKEVKERRKEEQR